jgi:capsular exopolysaccharide synthesis family protein
MVVTAVVIAAAVGVSRIAPPVYRSEAIVVVESRVRANTTPLPPDMGTEKELARSGVVVDPAARDLGLTAGELLSGLEVSVAPDANVLMFTYTDGDAVTARNRAQALALAYVVYRNSGESARTPTTSSQHATLVTDAVVPGAPVEQSVWINVGLGLAIGLLLGVGTALIRDRMNDRLRGRDDFARVAGVTVLATVPRVRRRRRADAHRPVIRSAPHSPAAEAFRYLRSRLHAHRRGSATILVTSPDRREGRTTTAANLAVAMAQAGVDVVLVDADTRDPSVHRAFEDQNSVGLTSVLAGEHTIENALRPTPVPGLRLLTAGPAAENAGDLLAGTRLRRLIDTLRSACDVVILDSGPVLGASETIPLAEMSDHVLLVVDYRRTTRGRVARALAEMGEAVHGSVSGVLLNAPRGAGGLVPPGRSPLPDSGPVAGAGAATPDPAESAAEAATMTGVPTVYFSSSTSTPAIPGFEDQPEHLSDPDLPVQPGSTRRRLLRRG